MITKRIKENIEYIKSVEIINQMFIVKVQYNSRWGTYPSEDEKIKVAKSEDTIGEWYYYANYDDVDIDDIIDLIEDTIRVNQNAVKKVELLSKKVEELKALFADNDYEKLETLQFVMEEPKKEKIKPKKTERKTKKTTKRKTKKNEKVKEDNNNVEEFKEQ